MKNWRESYFRTILYLFLFIYLVGIIGLGTSLHERVRALTPVNLLLTAGVLFLFHRRWDARFFVFMLVTALAGYFVEVLGVHTGMVFGHYTYGATLGPRLWDVPLMIGVNWLILIYAVGTMIQPLKGNWFIKSVLGALLMVLIDLPLEPVATQLDFWTWTTAHAPLQNFLGWYVVSLVLLAGYHRWVSDRENRMAPWVYGTQFVFFVVIYIMGQAR